MKTGSNRAVGGVGWNIWRAFIGLAYLAAAVFNTTYTLPRSDQLDGYAEGAWFPFLEDIQLKGVPGFSGRIRICICAWR